MNTRYPPEPPKWPHRATIASADDTVSFFGQARLNADGSVTVEEWGETGPYEATYPAHQVRNVQLAYEIESGRWFWLYEQVYGGASEDDDV